MRKEIRKRVVAVSLSTLSVATVLTACGGSTHESAPSTARSPSPASMPGNSMGGTATVVSLSGPHPAAQLRSALEMTLGDHVLLTVELMRDKLRPGPTGRTQAAVAAVSDNTKTLSDAMHQIYGARTAATFTTLWNAHVQQLSDYAVALAGHDTSGQRAANAQLHHIEGDLGTFLSTATEGRLTPAAARQAVTMHIQMLLAQADAYARGDYASAYEMETQGFDHMTAMADELASDIAAGKGVPTTELSLPSQQLQSALDRLFAEHMGVMVEAMRSAVDQSPDFASVGATLNANTAQLGAAIGALYGHAAADAFLNLWAQHVNALMAYANATATHDDAAKAAAQKSLADFVVKMAQFLGAATHLPAIQLTSALTQHDMHLTDQIDAYATGDFTKAASIAAAGYAHMFTLASTLATAIGDTVAARLPTGGAQTGGGGTAHR